MFLALAAAGLGASLARADARGEQVAALFAGWRDQPGGWRSQPGCAVGVIEDGRWVHQAGYGLANLDDRVPITAESVFRIGSTSKQFTALAVLLLEAEGKLSLDDDVRTVLPELAAFDPPVRLRHLVHHTSGLRDYLDLQELAGLRDDDFYTPAEALALIARQSAPDFPAGSAFLYSNTNYFLLGIVVERVAGTSLRRFADERIFAPLGMRSSHFHDDHTEVVPHRAVGYAVGPGGGFRVATTHLDLVGDGGVFTDLEDLLAWDRNFAVPRVGTPELIARMTTPGRLDSGETLDYGFGLGIYDYFGLREIAHAGGWVGYKAEILRFPERRLTVICLCNRNDFHPTPLAQQVADVYLGPRPRPAPIELPERTVESFVGRFLSLRFRQLAEVRADGGGLVFATDDGDRFALRPVARDRFVAVAGLRAELRPRDDGGVVVWMPEEEWTGRDYRRLATPDAHQAPASPEPLAGVYDCPEIGVVLRVSAEGGGLRLRLEPAYRVAPAAPFLPIAPDHWAAAGRHLEALRDGEGRVTGLRYGVSWGAAVVCPRRE